MSQPLWAQEPRCIEKTRRETPRCSALRRAARSQTRGAGSAERTFRDDKGFEASREIPLLGTSSSCKRALRWRDSETFPRVSDWRNGTEREREGATVRWMGRGYQIGDRLRISQTVSISVVPADLNTYDQTEVMFQATI